MAQPIEPTVKTAIAARKTVARAEAVAGRSSRSPG